MENLLWLAVFVGRSLLLNVAKRLDCVKLETPCGSGLFTCIKVQ